MPQQVEGVMPVARVYMSEEIEGEMPEEVQGEMPEEVEGGMPIARVAMSEEIEGEMPEEVQGEMPEEVAGKMPEEVDGEMPVSRHIMTFEDIDMPDPDITEMLSSMLCPGLVNGDTPDSMQNTNQAIEYTVVPGLEMNLAPGMIDVQITYSESNDEEQQPWGQMNAGYVSGPEDQITTSDNESN
ncbi:hypothetical protein BZA77DRAFT_297654 [Pyronema omphalodes]|nr:hypothetical protein BZA77DRAFT_297654 [Pyronema omphalodes]